MSINLIKPDKSNFINTCDVLVEWSKEQVASLTDIEKVSLMLTLSVDINGILTLDNAELKIERKVYETIKTKIINKQETPKKSENEWMEDLKQDRDENVAKRKNRSRPSSKRNSKKKNNQDKENVSL